VLSSLKKLLEIAGTNEDEK